MHLCVQHPCIFIGTKESVYIRKELKSHRIGLVQQHGCHFIVLEHQDGCRDAMYIHSISFIITSFTHSVGVLAW